ncbi:MAG: amidohydrolase [Rikenellaceae bacterium]|jgi:predicted amidohydrolase|nr:amidohydrolase [Rikenellaceae bacterium]
MKLSLLQTDLAWESPADNLEHHEELIEKADSSDLFVLPEMFSTGFVTDPQNVAEAVDEETGEGATFAWMQKVAAQKGAALAGSVAVNEGGNFYNRFYFVQPDGISYQYDKRHLFSMGGENKAYTRGGQQVMIQYLDFRIMPLVCYDLRFPVWSRSRGDCDLILYVASWPPSRIGAWDVLLRARAIENQCYVAGVNRVGNDPCHEGYSGHSVLVDYLGQPVVAAREGREEVVDGYIEREPLDEFRKKFPAFLDADKFDFPE